MKRPEEKQYLMLLNYYMDLEIPEDEKAQKDLNTTNLEITVEKNIATTFHEENKTENALKSTQQMVNLRAGQDKMFTLLMKMRR